MAFTLLHPADPFALTKAGRMRYTFSGDARIINPGVKAVNQIAFAKCPEGTQMKLIFDGRTYTYTARTAPRLDTEFSTGDGSAAYLDALVSFFATRYEIREAFTVTRDHIGTPSLLEVIVLTAKQPGPAYMVTPYTGITNNFSVGISTVNVTPGVDAQIRPLYGLHTEVWLEKLDGSAFYSIYNNTVEADENDVVSFDVGPILHAQFSLDWPDFTKSIPNLNPHSARRYFVAYGEAYDAPQQVGAIYETDKSWAYLGGADYISKAGDGFSLTNYVQSDEPGLDWALRFGSTTRYVRPEEPQFLTFLNTRGTVANLAVEVLATYDNGVEEGHTDLLPAISWPLGSKVTLPVGPTQLGLLIQQDGVTLQAYTVRIKEQNTDNYFSTAYRFVLNYKYEPYVRYFAFESSLGCIDTLCTFGKGSAELARFFEQAEQFLATGYEVTDGQFVDYDISIQQQFEVTTGYRDRAELARWNDFYRSPRRLLVQGPTVLPISVLSKSIKQAKDGDNQLAHSFQWTYAYQDAFYTGQQALEPGDPTPPPYFQPAGTVIVQPAEVAYAYDKTVPQAARELTPQVVDEAKQAYAWGNHAEQGYMTPAVAATKFVDKALVNDFLKIDQNAITGRVLAQFDVVNKKFTPITVNELAGVLGVKIAPVPIQVEDLAYKVGQTISDKRTLFTDPNKLPLTYSASGLPDGISVDSSTGYIQGTFTKADTSTVTITADNGNAQASQSFRIAVAAADAPPATPSATLDMRVFRGSITNIESPTGDFDIAGFRATLSNYPAGTIPQISGYTSSGGVLTSTGPALNMVQQVDGSWTLQFNTAYPHGQAAPVGAPDFYQFTFQLLPTIPPVIIGKVLSSTADRVVDWKRVYPITGTDTSGVPKWLEAAGFSRDASTFESSFWVRASIPTIVRVQANGKPIVGDNWQGDLFYATTPYTAIDPWNQVFRFNPSSKGAGGIENNTDYYFTIAANTGNLNETITLKVNSGVSSTPTIARLPLTNAPFVPGGLTNGIPNWLKGIGFSRDVQKNLSIWLNTLIAPSITVSLVGGSVSGDVWQSDVAYPTTDYAFAPYNRVLRLNAKADGSGGIENNTDVYLTVASTSVSTESVVLKFNTGAVNTNGVTTINLVATSKPSPVDVTPQPQTPGSFTVVYADYNAGGGVTKMFEIEPIWETDANGRNWVRLRCSANVPYADPYKRYYLIDEDGPVPDKTKGWAPHEGTLESFGRFPENYHLTPQVIIAKGPLFVDYPYQNDNYKIMAGACQIFTGTKP